MGNRLNEKKPEKQQSKNPKSKNKLGHTVKNSGSYWGGKFLPPTPKQTEQGKITKRHLLQIGCKHKKKNCCKHKHDTFFHIREETTTLPKNEYLRCRVRSYILAGKRIKITLVLFLPLQLSCKGTNETCYKLGRRQKTTTLTTNKYL